MIDQLPAGAMATAMLLAPEFQSLNEISVVQDVHYNVASPFQTQRSVKVFSDDILVQLARQKYLGASSAKAIPLSFTVESDWAIEDQSPEALVSELRRLAGLTWTQIAEMFGVSARAPYHWASGKNVSAENHQKLAEITAVIRYIDRGLGEENRNLLLGVAPGGLTYLNLLRDSKYEQIKKLAGKGDGRMSLPKGLSNDASFYNTPDHWGRSMEAFVSVDEAEILPESEPKLRRLKARRKSV